MGTPFAAQRVEAVTVTPIRWLSAHRQGLIAALALIAIAISLTLSRTPAATATWHGRPVPTLPLDAALLLGGVPLLVDLIRKLFRREFGSDLLAGLAIVTSVLLGQHLAGTLVVLMLSGGEALEQFAVRNASSALAALARRMPTRAHRRRDGALSDVALDDVNIGDTLVVLPHEICPVDGVVLEG